MRTAKTSQTPSSPLSSGPSAIPGDRRRRARLRDLCDEVLASFRLAREGEMFSAQDREEARKLLQQVAGR